MRARLRVHDPVKATVSDSVTVRDKVRLRLKVSVSESEREWSTDAVVVGVSGSALRLGD